LLFPEFVGKNKVKKPNELTIIEAREKIKEGKLTVTQLVKSCLEQIKQTDKKINAFITVCEKRALEKAKKFEQILKENPKITEKKPLFGIPVAVKDNFCTKGIKTTAASKILENFVPPYDATVVEKLKKAGAIIIGKTNMDAWAHGSSTETSDFGPTKNPHDLSRVPGGSSGGSAAAVAAHQTIAAIGSETAGSIRQPAAWCGVVGLKPTYGRVSRWGLIAMASSLDSPGPITKTVADAALLLRVIAGKDLRDATTLPNPVPNYEESLEQVSPSKITLGIPKEYFLPEMEKEVKEAVERAIKTLKKIGFRMKEVSVLNPKYSIAVYTIIQRAEVSSNLARYDGIRYGRSREFFGKEAKRRIMLGTYVLSAGYYDRYYAKAQKVRKLICQDFERIFSQVDALVAPTSPYLPLKLGQGKDEPMFGEKQDVLVEASSLAGLPGISINCASPQKLPVGLQIIAGQKKEELVLQIAYQYEKGKD